MRFDARAGASIANILETSGRRAHFTLRRVVERHTAGARAMRARVTETRARDRDARVTETRARGKYSAARSRARRRGAARDRGERTRDGTRAR